MFKVLAGIDKKYKYSNSKLINAWERTQLPLKGNIESIELLDSEEKINKLDKTMGALTGGLFLGGIACRGANMRLVKGA